MICTVSITFVTHMHVTIVLDKHTYTFYHKPSQLSFRTPLIYNISGSSSIVISENLDRSVKTLHFFELPVQEKNLHKKQSFRLSTMI